MKFNNPVNEKAVWSIIKSELGMDGKTSMELTRLITTQLKSSCEAALRMDRVELRRELEEETERKFKVREDLLKKREEAGGALTRSELIRCLADAVNDEDGKVNVQAATLLTKLEGFESVQQDIAVNLIDFSDAPDHYRTEIPEGI